MEPCGPCELRRNHARSRRHHDSVCQRLPRRWLPIRRQRLVSNNFLFVNFFMTLCNFQNVDEFLGNYQYSYNFSSYNWIIIYGKI